MTTSESLDNLRSRILAGYSMLFLQTWEEDRWEAEIASLSLEMERGLVVWTVTRGPQPPPGAPEEGPGDPMRFLEQIEAYPPEHVFFVKDFQPYLSDPRIVRRLRDLAAVLVDQRKTLLMVGPQPVIPIELQKDAIRIEMPLPGLEELRDVCAETLHPSDGSGPDIAPEMEEKILKAVLGLSLKEARKAIARALSGREVVDDDVFGVLVSEKKHMVQGSDLLDFYDLDAGVGDVGGLEGLKDWLRQRAEAFSNRAREQGIPLPKGALLLGVQGCGKSLSARATAKLLGFPLVRLDASNLLSSDRGSSERNMRDVLTLMETIAPAVLWLDEIEKGFAGADGDAGADAVMTRLVGRFLTWMDEKKQPVFVIATANSVTNLPPEMLRRGRFDELFFVDLPNFDERRHIFRIHLNKRGWKHDRYDLDALAEKTAGFSGAEIEQVVISAMLDAFGRGGILSQEHLELAREQTVPLSVTMEEKIFQLREWARPRCRPATPDSRVMQMLDEETRHGRLDETNLVTPQENEDWVALAEAGQMPAAAAEFVRRHGHVTFPQFQEAFREYLPVDGDIGLALKSDPNVVLWVGMSSEFSELMSKLIAGKRMYLHPADADRFRDATLPRLPLVKELTDDRLARPSFFPSCLREMPPTGGSGRFARVARMKLSR